MHQHTSLSNPKAKLTVTAVYRIPIVRTFGRGTGYILISLPPRIPTAKEKVERDGLLLEVLLCTLEHVVSLFSDPSNNYGDVLLQLTTLGAEVLATVGHYTFLSDRRGMAPTTLHSYLPTFLLQILKGV